MAKLTDTLPLTNGTNRVIDDPAIPSGVGTVLETMSTGLNAYMDLRRASSESKRKAAAEAERQRAKSVAFESQEAYFRATTPIDMPKSPTGVVEVVQDVENLPPVDTELPGGPDAQAVFSTGGPVGASPEAEADATKSGKRITNVAAAVDQGRMPAIALQTSMQREYQTLLNKYPDQAEHLLDIWKKMGMDTTVFRAGRDEADWSEFQREEQQNQIQDDRKFEQGMFEAGAKALGPLLAMNEETGQPYTREQVTAHGFAVTRQANEFAQTVAEADLAMKRGNLSKEQKTEIEGDKNQKIEQLLHVGIYNDSNPLISMVQNIAGTLSALPPGEAASKWVTYGPRINSVLENYVEQAVASAVAQGYTGDPQKLRTNLQQTVSRAKELWSGDFNVAKTYVDALNMTQTTLKLNAAQAMPVFTALKAIGVNAETIQGYMEGLAGNAELSGALRKEMMGFSTDFGQEKASTRLMNIIKIMRGESTLADMSGEQARRALPTLYAASDALNRRYVAGEPIDPNEITNAFGELTIATRSLGPTSGVDAFLKATQGIAITKQRAALLKAYTDPRADQDQVEATIMASRAGSAHLLNIGQKNLNKVNQNSNLFKLVWDDKNGRYFIDDSIRRKNLADMDRRIVAARARPEEHGRMLALKRTLSAAKAPTEMYQWQDGMNANLDNIMGLAKADPNTPKGTPLELRRYYGRNILPPSMRGTGKAATNPDKEIEKQFSTLDKTLDNLSLLNTNVEIADGAKDWSSAPNYSQIAPIVSSVAERHGVPAQLAINLIGEESSFNPAAAGPVIKEGTHKGDRAMGLGQVMAATAAKYGVSDRSKLGPEEQVDLAMRVLKDNHKSTGNWKDAVAMYFTGTTYAKALARNANDGNEGVMKYVNDALRGLSL